MFGLTRGTRKAHFVRAALEAMAYQTRDVLDAMQSDAGIALTELRADGGAIGNDFWPASGRHPRRATAAAAVDRDHRAGRGLPGRSGSGVLVQPRTDRRAMGLDRRFEPQMDVARREKLYAGWQQAVAATLAFHVD